MNERVPLTPDLFAAAERRGMHIEDREPPSRGTIEHDGLHLSYLDWGGPPEREVVFVHGGALTSRTWDLVCLALRGDFRCVALDLRGHGDSAWADGTDAYSLEAYARDVIALLSHLDLVGAVLVGMSLGGQAALLAAAARDAVRGLVLVDVGPEPDHAAAAAIIRGIREPMSFSRLEEVVELALKLNPRRRADELRHSVMHNLRPLADGGFTWKYDWRAFVGLTPETLDARASTLWRAVETIRCPVLVVRGSESAVLSREAAAVLGERLADGRVVVVEQAGHTVQGDNPAGFTRVLEPYLRQCFG